LEDFCYVWYIRIIEFINISDNLWNLKIEFMKNDVVEKILTETENGYDLIFEKFSQTRKKFWIDLEFIDRYVKNESKVFDFGCGNGRLFEFLNDKIKIEYWGADVSAKLIGVAKNKYFVENAHFLKLNSNQVDFLWENNFFDAVYSIAVFHHIPSRQIRLKLAKELFRLTKKGGHVVVTVWNLYQKKYFKNILQNFKNKILGKSELDWGDCYISFTNNQGQVFQRFHHAFTRRELKNLFEKAGFETEKCQVIGKKNIIYIGKK